LPVLIAAPPVLRMPLRLKEILIRNISIKGLPRYRKWRIRKNIDAFKKHSTVVFQIGIYGGLGRIDLVNSSSKDIHMKMIDIRGDLFFVTRNTHP